MTAPKNPSEPHKRQHDNYGSFTFQKDGYWHGAVTLTNPDGSPNRVQFKRRDHDKAREIFDELLAQSHAQATLAANVAPGTLGGWLDRWLNEIVDPKRKSTTYVNYEGHVRRHVLPEIGSIRLSKLTEYDINRVLEKLCDEGKRPTAEAVLKTLRAALHQAVDKHLIVNNVAKSANLPEITAKNPDEEDWEDDDFFFGVTNDLKPDRVIKPAAVKKLIEILHEYRNGPRFMMGLVYGLRQSECLGLVWEDVDWDNKTLRIARSWNRKTYRHGCPNPSRCEHTPGKCPQKIGKTQLTRPKTEDTVRTLPIGDYLLAALKDHRKRQLAERLASKEPWPNRNWMFPDRKGHPIQHDVDRRAWRNILKKAGIPHHKIHDMRHTVATMLGARGTDSKTMQVVLGWANQRMADIYKHSVAESVRNAVEDHEREIFGG